MKGKKFGNYNVEKSNFFGQFPHFYTVDEQMYREKKRKDLEEDETDYTDPKYIKKNLNINIYKKLVEKGIYTQKEMAEILNLDKKTIYCYRKELESLEK